MFARELHRHAGPLQADWRRDHRAEARPGHRPLAAGACGQPEVRRCLPGPRHLAWSCSLTRSPERRQSSRSVRQAFDISRERDIQSYSPSVILFEVSAAALRVLKTKCTAEMRLGSLLHLNRYWITISLLAAALVTVSAACAGGDEPLPAPSPVAAESTAPPAPPPSPGAAPAPTPRSVPQIAPAPVPDAVIVKAAEHIDLGTILVDGSGRTLYLFTDDERNTSHCSDGCAKAWPPLLTAGDTSAGEGVEDRVLATVTRDDGSEQVAYNGWPLYYFASDEGPGDAKGQNSAGFGLWFPLAVGPSRAMQS